MYFIIDNNLKIIFGWSAKCGCSHIKKIAGYLQTNNTNCIIHTTNETRPLPKNIQNYTLIIIIRNPYERIVSGFLDKYQINGECRNKWKESTITFSKFIDQLMNKNWDVIDTHHFTPQTTECFNYHLIKKSKTLKIYDICNIDYAYLEKIYNKSIPEDLIQFKGGHERKKNELFENPVYDLNMNEYVNFKVPTQYFYNELIKRKVEHFYKNDLYFFKNCNFNYILKLK